MGVLMVLKQHAGEVVSKTELTEHQPLVCLDRAVDLPDWLAAKQ